MDQDTAKWLFVIVAFFSFILLVAVIPSIISKYKSKIKELNAQQASQKEIDNLKHEGTIKDKNLIIEKLQTEMKGQAQDLAVKQFDEWKERELDTHRKVIIQAAIEKAQAMLAEWKIEEGDKLRKDAVKRSMGVNFGKITEHLIPFSKHLEDFDPRDIRFIGSPVDLMIFDGATQKDDQIDIYFVEIKTGSGVLSKKQKTIRDAIENHRIHWKPITVPEFKWDVPDEEDNGATSSPSS